MQASFPHVRASRQYLNKRLSGFAAARDWMGAVETEGGLHRRAASTEEGVQTEELWSYGDNLTPAGHEMLAALVFRELVVLMETPTHREC
jgi:hypothetical protein